MLAVEKQSLRNSSHCRQVSCDTHTHTCTLTLCLYTAPALAPTDVAVKRLNSTSTKVSWTPLSLVDAQGFIAGYLLSYETTTSTRNRRASVEVSSDTSLYIITGLMAESKVYGVTVACITEAGVGPVSAAISEPGVPPYHVCVEIECFISICGGFILKHYGIFQYFNIIIRAPTHTWLPHTLTLRKMKV